MPSREPDTLENPSLHTYTAKRPSAPPMPSHRLSSRRVIPRLKPDSLANLPLHTYTAKRGLIPIPAFGIGVCPRSCTRPSALPCRPPIFLRRVEPRLMSAVHRTPQNGATVLAHGRSPVM